jgi:hypothetical protein
MSNVNENLAPSIIKFYKLSYSLFLIDVNLTSAIVKQVIDIIDVLDHKLCNSRVWTFLLEYDA